MKKLIYLSSVLLINLACNSDDNDTDTSVETPVLVTKLNVDGETANIKYDGNKIIEVALEKDLDKTVYTYTGNLISQIQEYDSEGKLFSTSKLSYENDRLAVVKVEGTTSGSNAAYSKTFTYTYPNSGTANCTEIYTYKSGSQTITIKDEFTYTLSNNNIVAETDKYYVNNVLSGEINSTLTYDDKNNPFMNILGFDKISLYNYEQFDHKFSGKNNAKLYSQTNKPVNSQATSYKVESSLSYNAKNYPTQDIEKYYSGNQVTNTFVTNYTYNQ